MKYTILINQRVVAQMGLKLDLVDLALFDFIKSYLHSTSCTRFLDNGREYGWIDPNLVIKEMPILGIGSTRGINLRIDNLINAGLIQRAENNQAAKKSFFCMGPRFDEYEGFVASNSEEIPAMLPKKAPVQKKEVVVNIADHLKNNAEFMTWWQTLLQEKKWKEKSQRALQMSMDKLNAVSAFDAIYAIKEAIERGYQGIFPKATRPIASPAPVRSTQQTSLEELMGGK